MPRKPKSKIVNLRSTGTLEEKPMEELEELFFELTGKRKTWADKAELARAVIATLASGQRKPMGRPRTRMVPDSPEPPNRKPMFRDPLLLEPKRPGEDTKRGAILDMLRQPGGATFAQIGEALDMTYGQAFANMRCLVKECGYGLFEYPNKHIVAYTHAEGPPCD